MHRFCVATLITCTRLSLATSIASAQIPPLDLRSPILTPPVSIEKGRAAFYSFRLDGKIDEKGEGRGVLTLNPNPPEFDAFGTGLISSSKQKEVKINVSIHFVRSGRTQIEAGPPPEEWYLYRITSDKLPSPIGLSAPDRTLLSGRLLISGERERIISVVELRNPFPPRSDPLPAPPP